MELTKEKYLSICEKNGFLPAKRWTEVNRDNFYLPIELAPCFLSQLDALAFLWFEGKCYSHFQRDDFHEKTISTVEDLQNEIERCKELYEWKCRDAAKKMVAVKKKEIQKAGGDYEV